MKSTKWRLQAMDWFRGLVIAVFAPILPIIMESFSKGVFTLDWQLIKTVALGAFSAYILHKFGSDDVKQAQKTLDNASKK